jgi:hypothetical protein
MKVIGNYAEDGYALVEGLIPPEVAVAFIDRLQTDLEQSGVALGTYGRQSPLLSKPSIEIYGYHYKPMITFLWGLTPLISQLTGRDLLPTYNYFRIYRQGDICRVHSDRPSCEHSLSLTLAYSDGKQWGLEVSKNPIDAPRPIADDFGDDPCSTIAMRPGDAVLYKGVTHRHGRVAPNPNRWSAHMFLHFVDRKGPHADCAFDPEGRPSGPPRARDFQFN